jgi:hypothetical protein
MIGTCPYQKYSTLTGAVKITSGYILLCIGTASIFGRYPFQSRHPLPPQGKDLLALVGGFVNGHVLDDCRTFWV